MADFSNASCSKCSKKIGISSVESSDVVVCPICGAPYHRSCYKKAEQCVFSNKHEQGYIWKGKIFSKSEEDEVKCPSCLHSNPCNAACCEKCNFSLAENRVNHKETIEESELKNEFLEGAPRKFIRISSGSDFIFNNNLNSTEKLKDIELGIWRKYIQKNSEYYIPEFKRIETESKCCFNFSAFFFGGLWFLYRKCNRISYIVLSSMGSCFHITRLLQTVFINKIYEEVLRRLPNNIKFPERDLVFYKELLSLPFWQVFVYFLPGFLALCYFAIMICCGKFANKWYMKECEKRIEKIRQSSNNNNKLDQKLLVSGGVANNVVWVTISLFLMFMSVLYAFS